MGDLSKVLLHLRHSQGFVGGHVQGPPAPAAQPRLRGRGFVGDASWVRLHGQRVQGPLRGRDQGVPSHQRRVQGVHPLRGIIKTIGLLCTLQYCHKSLGTIVIIKASLHPQRRPGLLRTLQCCIKFLEIIVIVKASLHLQRRV